MIRARDITLITILLFLVSPISVLAQDTIRGTVIDNEDSAPVPGAYICAFSDNKLLGYCTSESDGTFFLNCKKTPERITVSMLGYEVFKTDNLKDNITIRLKSKALELKGSVKKSSLVTAQGDTLDYAASAFKTENDRSLGDLLQNLPNISVTQGGGIMYNGIYIRKFYVEGMDLMGGGYGVITNNLDADKIARVEVYRNHQPIKALKNTDSEGKTAINIILKEDYRNTWIGSADASLGAPVFPLFNAKAMASQFGKKKQSLFLAKANNLGQNYEDELQIKPYGNMQSFSFTPGIIEKDFRTPLTSTFPIASIPNEYYVDNTAALATVNRLIKIDSTRQVRFSVNYSYNLRRNEHSKEETISLGDEDYFYRLVQNDETNSRTNYLRVGSFYEDNKAERYFSNEFLMSAQYTGSDAKTNAYSTSPDSESDDEFRQHYTLPSLKIEDNLNWAKKYKVFSVEATSRNSFVRNAHNSLYYTCFPASSGRIWTNVNQSYQENSFKSNNSAEFSTRLHGFRIKLVPSLEIGYIKRNTVLSNSLEGILEGASVNGEYGIFYLTPEVKAVISKYIGRTEVTLNIPAGYMAILPDLGEKVTSPYFRPQLYLQRNFGNRLSGLLQASFSKNASSPGTINRTTVMTDYRTVLHGDTFHRSTMFDANMNIKYSDMINLFFASLTASHHKYSDDTAPKYSIKGNFYIKEFLPTTSVSTSSNIRLTLSKYIGAKTLNIDLSGGLTSTSSEDYVNSYPYNSFTFTKDIRLTLKSNPARWIQAEVTGSWDHSDIRSSGSEQSKASSHETASDRAKASTFMLNATLGIYPTRRLNLTSDVFLSERWFRDNHITTPPLIKVTAEWKFSLFSLFVSYQNLLDISSLDNITQDRFITSSTSQALRGREFLIGFRMTN